MATTRTLIDAPIIAALPTVMSGSFRPHSSTTITQTATKAYIAEFTADGSVDLFSGSLTLVGGAAASNFTTVVTVMAEIIKTASEVSGNVTITLDDTSASGRLEWGDPTPSNLPNAQLAAVGDVLAMTCLSSCDALTMADILSFDFTTPVGFKVRITVIGT